MRRCIARGVQRIHKVPFPLHALRLGDSINITYYRQPMMKKLDIVPPNENFRGRSYGIG